jgi:hypothetical protein
VVTKEITTPAISYLTISTYRKELVLSVSILYPIVTVCNRWWLASGKDYYQATIFPNAVVFMENAAVKWLIFYIEHATLEESGQMFMAASLVVGQNVTKRVPKPSLSEIDTVPP